MIPIRRILVIKFRHIGDVLLTAPLISTLKQGLPEVRVYAAVKEGTEAMLEGHPDLDTLFVLPVRRATESHLHFMWRSLRFLWQLRRERIDLAINTTEGDRGILLAWLIGARERWGIVKPGREKTWQARKLTRHFAPLDGYTHTVIRNLALAAPLGLPECREVKLFVSDADRARVSTLLTTQGVTKDTPLIHCHPASRWLFKCLPAHTVAEVIDWLQAGGYRVVLTCAPDPRERTLLDAILAAAKSAPIDLGGQLSLKQTAALSAMSRLFFGVDSAPMHMAAAVGTPTLGVFGPSGTFDWGPWPNGWQGEGTPYPGWNGIKHADAHTVVQDTRPCAPCGRAGCENTRRSACLDELPVAKLVTELNQMLLN
ncbi:MAG: putative lipopolysaccharide heptosyltransferase III [Betaproteobacteria bacterium]|nr:MAG: putative lipopolysaccharide heptosyltransferase III [Betaproteobacteria bacterium]